MKTALTVLVVVGTGGLAYWAWKRGVFSKSNIGPPATNPAPSMCSQVLTGAANIAIKTGDPKTKAGGVVVGVTAPALCKAASWAIDKAGDAAKGIYAGTKAAAKGVGVAAKWTGNTVWTGTKAVGSTVADVGEGTAAVFTNTKKATPAELAQIKQRGGSTTGGLSKTATMIARPAAARR